MSAKRRRAALYARYSTDLQSERSIEDQLALCRAYAEREGLVVVGTYHDRARSGGTLVGRDGLMDLLALAERGETDVVVVEALDRLSRDMEDLAGIHKRLRFRGVEILAVHEGRADTVLVGLRGLVGQLFREDGARKVRRGMAGVVASGRSAGGRAYGYRPVPGAPGRLDIVPDEAQTVRRIFAAYVDGATPRAIAATLNTEGVPPPRGVRWNASTLNGSRERGNGILACELYAGEIVWNKVSMVVDPRTGKRISRPNPPEAWQRSSAPELRIVDEETWAAAQARKDGRSRAPVVNTRRPRHLFSGLLRCGICGGGYSVHDRDRSGKTRIRCSTIRESGACTNRRTLYVADVESVVLEGLRAELRRPELIEAYVAAYAEERRRLSATARADRATLERRLAEATRAYERTKTLFVKGLISEEDAERDLPALLAERDRLRGELAAADDDEVVIALHPAALGHYRAAVDKLAETLSDHARAGETEIVDTLRELVDTIVIHPEGAKASWDVEVRGRLAYLVGPDAFPSRRLCGVSVVAEARCSRCPTQHQGTFVLRFCPAA